MNIHAFTIQVVSSFASCSTIHTNPHEHLAVHTIASKSECAYEQEGVWVHKSSWLASCFLGFVFPWLLSFGLRLSLSLVLLVAITFKRYAALVVRVAVFIKQHALRLDLEGRARAAARMLCPWDGKSLGRDHCNVHT